MKLYLLITITLLVQYSLSWAMKERIYVRSWIIDDSVKVTPGQIYKNTYDVIYETRKYELYLVDESSKNNPFISNYERLTINLGKDFVEVSLSDELVVRRRIQHKNPILDLRLALYELFFGRRRVQEQLEELTQNSLKRMSMLERLDKKQNKANSKVPEHGKESGVSSPSLGLDKSKKSKNNNENSSNSKAKPSDEANSLSKRKDNFSEAQNTILKGKHHQQDKSEKKFGSESENDKNKSIFKANKSTTSAPESNLSIESGGSEKIQGESKPNETSEISDEIAGNKNSELNLKYVPAEKEAFMLGYLGYSSLSGENKEIITTKTNFNFITLGLRWTNEITKEASKGFFANLDEELRLLYRISSGNKDYEVPNGRQIEFYMGTPLLGGGLSLGFTGTHETTSFAGLKGIGQGIKIIELGELLFGPEIKFLIYRGRFRIQGYVGYQIPATITSNIKGDVDLRKKQVEIDVLDSSDWGVGLRYESYDISINRDFGDSKISPTQLSIMMFIRF